MDDRRQRLYRTPAIVLKRYSFEEADRILTLFTPDHGKLRVIAKGVRKITSRKSGHVELFTYANLLIARGRNLDIVTQAETINPFRALREDLSRITYAFYVGELVDRFTQDADENRPLFDLLLSTLDVLGTTNDLQRVTRYFELRLLDTVGYRPELFRCVQCGHDIEAVENFFGLETGGVVCPNCVVAIPGATASSSAQGATALLAVREGEAHYTADRTPTPLRPVSVTALKVLRFMQREVYPAVQRLSIRPETHGEMERLMHHYLTHLLERDLKSAAFLEMMK
jgi:DNA repair protein RecO (recombination protein O)